MLNTIVPITTVPLLLAVPALGLKDQAALDLCASLERYRTIVAGTSIEDIAARFRERPPSLRHTLSSLEPQDVINLIIGLRQFFPNSQPSWQAVRQLVAAEQITEQAITDFRDRIDAFGRLVLAWSAVDRERAIHWCTELEQAPTHDANQSDGQPLLLGHAHAALGQTEQSNVYFNRCLATAQQRGPDCKELIALAKAWGRWQPAKGEAILESAEEIWRNAVQKKPGSVGTDYLAVKLVDAWAKIGNPERGTAVASRLSSPWVTPYAIQSFVSIALGWYRMSHQVTEAHLKQRARDAAERDVLVAQRIYEQALPRFIQENPREADIASSLCLELVRAWTPLDNTRALACALQIPRDHAHYTVQAILAQSPVTAIATGFYVRTQLWRWRPDGPLMKTIKPGSPEEGDLLLPLIKACIAAGQIDKAEGLTAKLTVPLLKIQALAALADHYQAQIPHTQPT